MGGESHTLNSHQLSSQSSGRNRVMKHSPGSMACRRNPGTSGKTSVDVVQLVTIDALEGVIYISCDAILRQHDFSAIVNHIKDMQAIGMDSSCASVQS